MNCLRIFNRISFEHHALALGLALGLCMESPQATADPYLQGRSSCLEIHSAKPELSSRTISQLAAARAGMWTFATETLDPDPQGQQTEILLGLRQYVANLQEQIALGQRQGPPTEQDPTRYRSFYTVANVQSRDFQNEPEDWARSQERAMHLLKLVESGDRRLIRFSARGTGSVARIAEGMEWRSSQLQSEIDQLSHSKGPSFTLDESKWAQAAVGTAAGLVGLSLLEMQISNQLAFATGFLGVSATWLYKAYREHQISRDHDYLDHGRHAQFRNLLGQIHSDPSLILHTSEELRLGGLGTDLLRSMEFESAESESQAIWKAQKELKSMKRSLSPQSRLKKQLGLWLEAKKESFPKLTAGSSKGNFSGPAELDRVRVDQIVTYENGEVVWMLFIEFGAPAPRSMSSGNGTSERDLSDEERENLRAQRHIGLRPVRVPVKKKPEN